mgnify:CR=1 FL=1
MCCCLLKLCSNHWNFANILLEHIRRHPNNLRKLGFRMPHSDVSHMYHSILHHVVYILHDVELHVNTLFLKNPLTMGKSL